MAIIPETEVVARFAYGDDHITLEGSNLADSIIMSIQFGLVVAGGHGLFLGADGVGYTNFRGDEIAYRRYQLELGSSSHLRDASIDASTNTAWILSDGRLFGLRTRDFEIIYSSSTLGPVAELSPLNRLLYDGTYDFIAADRGRLYLGVRGAGLQDLLILDQTQDLNAHTVVTISNEVRRFLPYNNITVGAYDIHNGWEGQWEGTHSLVPENNLQAYFRQIAADGDYVSNAPEYSIINGDWSGKSVRRRLNGDVIEQDVALTAMYGNAVGPPDLFWMVHPPLQSIRNVLHYGTIEGGTILDVQLPERSHDLDGAVALALEFRPADPAIAVDIVVKRIALVSTGSVEVLGPTGDVLSQVQKKRVMAVVTSKNGLPDEFFESRLSANLFYEHRRYDIVSWESSYDTDVVTMELTF